MSFASSTNDDRPLHALAFYEAIIDEQFRGRPPPPAPLNFPECPGLVAGLCMVISAAMYLWGMEHGLDVPGAYDRFKATLALASVFEVEEE